MNTIEQLALVGSYLKRFFYYEPNDDVASLNALNAFMYKPDDRWKLAEAFRAVLEASLHADTLKQFVQLNARRGVTDDEQAREFLQSIYHLTALDIAPNYDEYRD